jgi:hypothetical protein
VAHSRPRSRFACRCDESDEPAIVNPDDLLAVVERLAATMLTELGESRKALSSNLGESLGLSA